MRPRAQESRESESQMAGFVLFEAVWGSTLGDRCWGDGLGWSLLSVKLLHLDTSPASHVVFSFFFPRLFRRIASSEDFVRIGKMEMRMRRFDQA